REPHRERVRNAEPLGTAREGPGPCRRGDLVRPRGRSSAGDLREDDVSFAHPIFLLGLVLLAAAVGVWFIAERRKARYALRYPNLDVLASVVPARSWSRFVPPALFLLALAALLVAVARPEVNRMVANERATVILVVDTSRSMQS